MIIYGSVIFILLFIIMKSLIVRCICKFCNVKKIFETHKGSIYINLITNVFAVIFSLCSYMLLVKIGV